MIKLIRMTIVALFLSVATTPLMAGSGDFSGPYVSFSGSVVGGALEGEYTDETGEVYNGTGGATFPVVGFEAGWNIGLGDTFLIGIGGSYTPGSAKLINAADNNNSADVRITLSDHATLFIQPQISFAENSEVYAKFGVTQVLLNCAGAGITNAGKCKNIDGTTYAVGTKTKLGNGLYFQTEAGATGYQSIFITGLVSGNDNTNGTLSAKPTVAYGKVAIGYQF